MSPFPHISTTSPITYVDAKPIQKYYLIIKQRKWSRDIPKVLHIYTNHVLARTKLDDMLYQIGEEDCPFPSYMIECMVFNLNFKGK